MAPDDPIRTRRWVLIGVTALIAGCTGADDDGDDRGGRDGATPAGDGAGTTAAEGTEGSSGSENPATGEVTPMGELTLTSPAFDDGERIPEKYGYQAENVNPPLEITGVPDATESLALVVDDPDAVEPAGKVWDHWVVWNIPTDRTTIPEGWEPDEATEGTNDYGEVGYGGPNPPDREHRYRFKLFAVETTVDLPTSADAERLGEAMEGDILEQTQLDGTYPA